MWQKTKLWLIDWGQKHPLEAIIGGAILLLAISEGIKKINNALALIERLISAGSFYDPKTQAVMPKPWLSWLLGLVALSLAVFIALYVRAQSELSVTVRRSAKRSEVAIKTLSGMMAAAFRIRQQLIPAAQIPQRQYDSIATMYLIHKDFTVDVTRTLMIRATEKPIHFVEIQQRVETPADPVEYLDDMSFKVKDESGHQVVYLPALNDGRFKRVVLYFLPFIDPEEKEARKIVISYSWPRMLRQLQMTKQELFTWHIVSREPVGTVDYSLFLEPGTGEQLGCVIAGTQSGEQALKEETHPEDPKWPGWVYSIKNAPAGDYALHVKLRTA
jgi:hypothetical protein